MREKRKKEKKTEEVSFKKEAVKVLKAVIIFFVVYFSIYKLYHMSAHKKLSYDDVYSISIVYYNHSVSFNEEDSKKIVELFNDMGGVERNLGCAQIGTPEYEMRICLKNGTYICLYPGSKWSVERYDQASLNWLDSWGNIGAENNHLFYWAQSSELQEIWDESVKEYKNIS